MLEMYLGIVRDCVNPIGLYVETLPFSQNEACKIGGKNHELQRHRMIPYGSCLPYNKAKLHRGQ